MYLHTRSAASPADTVRVGSGPSEPDSRYPLLLWPADDVLLVDVKCCVWADKDEEEEEEEEEEAVGAEDCLASTLCTMEKQHTMACSLCSMTLRASISAAE